MDRLICIGAVHLSLGGKALNVCAFTAVLGGQLTLIEGVGMKSTRGNTVCLKLSLQHKIILHLCKAFSAVVQDSICFLFLAVVIIRVMLLSA